ncbi:1-Cys peroxiredoxin [Linum perenne]
MPGLTIGDTVPNLEVESTHGVIKLHDFVSNSWTILFSHPDLQPGSKVTYPIISDPKREVIKQLNMVDPDEKDPSGNNVPSRALHIVGPDKKVKLSFLYPASTGRNMDEVMRVVESLQRAAKHKIATPADWKPGEAVVISPSVSNEEADKMFPQGYKTADLPSNKGYLRFTHVD